MKNDFELSATRMFKNSNFKDYSDNSDEMVSYEGKLIKRSQLPIVDYNVGFGAKFAHNISISSFNISNFITHTGKVSVLSQKYVFGKSTHKYEYQRSRLPSRTIWDMRISYEKAIGSDFRFFANLDINNILNKMALLKYFIDISWQKILSLIVISVKN